MVRKSKQSGFSLMELMIVVAILSIMATFAIPGYMSWRKDFWVKGAARDLLGNMQKAKMTAIKERTEVTFEFDSGGYSYLAYIDNDGTTGYNAGTTDELVLSETWGDQVLFDTDTSLSVGGNDGVSFTNNKTNFRPTGIPSLLGTIYITNDGGKKLKVALSQAGNIRIAEY